MAQLDSICRVELMDQQGKAIEILKAVIRREIELWFVCQRLPHAEQGFIVSTLDVRLDIGRAQSAEDGIHRDDARLYAFFRDGTVPSGFVVEGEYRIFIPCA